MKELNRLKTEIIVNYITNYYKLESPEEIFKMTRIEWLCDIRQLVFYFFYNHLELTTFDEIGKIGLMYGRKNQYNHATILHACNKINGKLEMYKNFKNEVNKINSDLINKFENIKIFEINTKYNAIELAQKEHEKTIFHFNL